MKMDRRNLEIVLVVVVVMGLLCPVAFSSGEKTITGKVNATFQIITDSGETYEVAENELGDEVVELIGKKVKATGTIEIEEGKKTITITGYDVIEE